MVVVEFFVLGFGIACLMYRLLKGGLVLCVFTISSIKGGVGD